MREDDAVQVLLVKVQQSRCVYYCILFYFFFTILFVFICDKNQQVPKVNCWF